MSFLLNELQIIYPWSASWYCFSVVLPLVSPSLPPQLIQQYSCPVVSYCLIMYFAEQSFKNETIKLVGGRGKSRTTRCAEREGETKDILKGEWENSDLCGVERTERQKQNEIMCIRHICSVTLIYIKLYVVLDNTSCSYLTWFNKYLGLFIMRSQPAPISWSNRHTLPPGRERMPHCFTKLENKPRQLKIYWQILC